MRLHRFSIVVRIVQIVQIGQCTRELTKGQTIRKYFMHVFLNLAFASRKSKPVLRNTISVVGRWFKFWRERRDEVDWLELGGSGLFVAGRAFGWFQTGRKKREESGLEFFAISVPSLYVRLHWKTVWLAYRFFIKFNFVALSEFRRFGFFASAMFLVLFISQLFWHSLLVN